MKVVKSAVLIDKNTPGSEFPAATCGHAVL
jgi:hypothetical protein